MDVKQRALTAAAGAGAVGYWLWRRSDLRRVVACIPQRPFAAAAAPAPPDYDDEASWAAHPGRAPGRAVEDANHIALPSDAPPPPAERAADTFFVHDSCYNPSEAMPFLGASHPFADIPEWNAPVRAAAGSVHAALAAKVGEQVDLRVACGAAPFNAACRVYAPRYRQANVLAYAHATGVPVVGQKWAEARQAFDLAYSDVARAFRHFCSVTGERPFFIAGHSQGSQHLTRLVQEEIEGHPDRLARFVHGYLTGMGVPLDLWAPGGLRSVRPSASADDTRSVSSWRTGRDGHRVGVGYPGKAYYAGKGWAPMPPKMLATNPVTWTQGPGDMSRADQYLGAAYPLAQNIDPVAVERSAWLPSGVSLRYGHLVRKSRSPLGVVVPALVPVDCGEVRVRVDQLGVTRVPRLPKQCLFAITEKDALLYHDVDVTMFHNNVRANVRQRLAAFMQRGAARSRL